MDAVVAIIIALAVIALAIGVYAAFQRSRRQHLRERFGDEYDRTVERAGGKRHADRDLSERERVRDELEIRELEPEEKARYRDEWESVQASFVDRPEHAVQDADRLIASAMRDRGYPVEDADRRAELLSVDHTAVVERYRKAGRIAERHRRGGETDTEQLRNAFVDYRALFEDLVGDTRHEPTSGAGHERTIDLDAETGSAPAEHRRY